VADTDRINIYQLNVQNGNRCGFWVKRETWSRNIARITTIGGQFEGLLDGNPPYLKSQKVRGDVCHEDTGAMRWNMGGPGRDQEITGAGTYRYSLVDTSPWWEK